MKRRLTAALPILLAAASPASAAPCAMTQTEKTWVERSLTAWETVRTNRLKLDVLARPVIVLFNNRCRFEARGGPKPDWRGETHSGILALPNGEQVEAGVISAAMSNDKTGEPFFVMALPSVWREAKIAAGDGGDGLTGVFLHEYSHVIQVPVLKPFWDEAKRRFAEPEDLSDDRIQHLFQKDPAYVAVAEKERDLFFEAANEPDAAKAKALVGQALALRDARQNRWFVGESAVWQPYDEIFLTMEGFGQWAAYSWLSDPRGGGLSSQAAQDKMRGSRRWWSQDTGFSAFLVIDRFVPGWPALAFGERPAQAIDLLRLIVPATEPAEPAEPPSP